MSESESESTGHVPDFSFRHFEAGPRRDVAREFAELVLDLGWLRQGEKLDAFLAKLEEAKNLALACAEDMLRSE